MLHPNQFQVNEAWIAFRLNEAPVETEHDGAFNCVALMDAASCFILGTTFLAAAESELSKSKALSLLKDARKHKEMFPATLFVPTGQFQGALSSQAQQQGISVISVDEIHLLVFVSDARQGFKEHFDRKQ